MPDCYFDDSLPRLLQILVEKLGVAQVEAGVVIRDASGRLGFFAGVELDPSLLREIDNLVRASLGSYARPDRLVVRAGDPGAQRVLQDSEALLLPVTIADHSDVTIRYIDRRIVGADWLRRPAPPPEPDKVHEAAARTPRAQRVVFSSLKGGVGRSTGLTVVAAEQARKGRNVLVVDLDLEAPGIGSLLLSEDRMPSFGVIDYLVERNLGSVDRAVLNDMVGTSALTQGHGLVDVVPAVGSRTLGAPGNYLAKVSRAMTEAVADSTGPVSLAIKLQEMLSDLEALRRYDVVLVDVRAGLAELTAGPFLVLDAEILVFVTAQRQTFQDLRFLFAHLATLTRTANPAYWSRLKMVHAKALPAGAAKDFRDELWELFATYLYVEADGLEEFNYDAEMKEAPHYPVSILLDPAFADWEPVKYPDRILESYYSRTFGELIGYIDDLVSIDQDDANAQD